MTHCGSRLLANVDKITENIDVLRGSLDKVSASISDYHNNYVCYTVMLLMYGTGGRPVIDPFAYWADFDIERKVACLNDKVPTHLHENRMVWLPVSASEQLTNYKSHLKGLASCLYKDKDSKVSDELIHQIGILSDSSISKSDQPLPLFFFLDEDLSPFRVSPSSLRKYLGNDWRYPLNQGRYCLEGLLHENFVDQFAIDVQMGHITNGHHHFSSHISISPSEIGEKLICTVEMMLEKLGFQAVESNFARFRENVKVNVIPKRHEKFKTFGPELRKRQRKLNRKKISEKIKQIIRGLNLSGSGSVDEDVQEEIREYIDKETVLYLQNRERLHRMLTRYLNFRSKHLKQKGQRQRLSRWEIPVIGKDNPFYDGFIRDLKYAHIVQSNFVSYLNDHGSSESDLNFNLRWAEIVFSACISGGLYNPKWLNSLANSDYKDVARIRSAVYVNIWCDHDNDHPDVPEWRFIFDKMTWSLVDGAANNKKGLGIRVSKAAINDFIVSLGNKIGIHGESKEDVVSNLCGIFQPYWRYYLSPCLCEIIEQRIPNTVFTDSVLQRVLRGHPIKISKKITKEIIEHERLIPVTYSTEYISEKEFFDWIKLELGKPSGKKFKDADKEEFSSQLNGKTGLSPICTYIGSWIESLILYGGAVKDELAISSIERYIEYIAPLATLVDSDDLVSMDIEERSDCYNRLLQYDDTYNSREKRGRMLQNFHMFLQSRTSIGGFFWGEIGLDAFENYRFVADANIITQIEYHEILRQIYESEGLDEFDKSWIGMIVIFGYRFGLRISECLNLKINDVQIIRDDSSDEDKVLFFNVKINREIKTKNSIRNIPLVGGLTEIENSMVMNSVRFSKSRYSKNIESGVNRVFLEDRFINNQPVEKSEVYRKVHYIIRTIIKDPNVRFHHLRHSFCTRLYEGVSKFTTLVGERSLGSSENRNITARQLSKVSSNERSLSFVSSMVGHGNSVSTVSSYIHSMDLILEKYSSSVSISGLSKTGAQYITQLSSKDLNRGYLEARAKKQEGYKYLLSRSKNKYIKDQVEPNKKFGKIKFSIEKSVKKLSLIELDELFKAYFISDSGEVASSFPKYNFETIDYWLQMGKRCSERSGFDGYGLQRYQQNCWADKSYETNGKTIESENKNLSEVIRSIGRYENSSTLSYVLEIWSRVYRDYRRYGGEILVFDQKSDFYKFVAFVKSAIGDLINFRAYYQRNINPKEIKRIESFVTSCGVNRIGESPKLPKYRSSIPIVVGLSMMDSDSHTVRYPKTLNRALFLAYVLHESKSH